MTKSKIYLKYLHGYKISTSYFKLIDHQHKMDLYFLKYNMQKKPFVHNFIQILILNASAVLKISILSSDIVLKLNQQ